MGESVIDLVIRDHRETDQLLETLESGSGDRAAVLAKVTALLTAHAQAEEKVLYPAIREGEVLGEEGELVDEADEEHEQVEQLLEQLAATDPDDTQAEQLIGELVAAVRHHVEEEEQEILPKVAAALEDRRLEELGQQFRKQREQELSSDELAHAVEEERS